MDEGKVGRKREKEKKTFFFYIRTDEDGGCPCLWQAVTDFPHATALSSYAFPAMNLKDKPAPETGILHGTVRPVSEQRPFDSSVNSLGLAANVFNLCSVFFFCQFMRFLFEIQFVKTPTTKILPWTFKNRENQCLRILAVVYCTHGFSVLSMEANWGPAVWGYTEDPNSCTHACKSREPNRRDFTVGRRKT